MKKLKVGQILNMNRMDLSIHPVADDPRTMLPLDGEDFLSMVESFKKHGVMFELAITPTGQIVDGRHRFEGTKPSLANIEELPCKVFSEGDAWEILLAAVKRRQTTVAHKVMAAMELVLSVNEDSKARQIKNLKKGTRGSTGAFSGKWPTLQSLANDIGVSVQSVNMGLKVERLFQENDTLIEDWKAEWGEIIEDLLPDSGADWNAWAIALTKAIANPQSELRSTHPDLFTGKKEFRIPESYRQKYEPLIFHHGMGFKGVAQGIGGADSTKGKTRADKDLTDQTKMLAYAKDRINRWHEPFEKWEMVEADNRKPITDLICKKISELPDDVIEAVATAILERNEAI